MRAFRCEVVISVTKAGVLTKDEPKIWIVKAADEEAAGKKIFSHFKEYGLLGRYRNIFSIHSTEIFLSHAMDLEEYLEFTEDATVCVLF